MKHPFFREFGKGADWRITVADTEGEYITTEFATSGQRSPSTTLAISLGLRSLESIDLSLPNTPHEVSRKTDENAISLTVRLIGKKVAITLAYLDNIPHATESRSITVESEIDVFQQTFFLRLMEALHRDNTVNPIE